MAFVEQFRLLTEPSDFRNNLKELLGLLQKKGYRPLIRKVARVEKSSFTTRVGAEAYTTDRLEEDEWWTNEAICPKNWENDWRLEHGQRALLIGQLPKKEVEKIDPKKVVSVGFRISWNDKNTAPSQSNKYLSLRYNYLDILVNKEGTFKVETGVSESRSCPVSNNVCPHDYNDYPYSKDIGSGSFQAGSFQEIEKALKETLVLEETPK